MKCRRVHSVGMPGQNGDAFAAGHVPDADSAIRAGRGQQAPVGAKRDGENIRLHVPPTGRVAREFVPVSRISICVRLHPSPQKSFRLDCKPVTSFRRCLARPKSVDFLAPVAASMICRAAVGVCSGDVGTVRADR